MDGEKGSSDSFLPFHPPTSMFPPAFGGIAPGLRTMMDLDVHVPQSDGATVSTSLKQLMEDEGTIYWDTLDPFSKTNWPRRQVPAARYAESGHAFPDAFITVYTRGRCVHYPIHRFIFGAYCINVRDLRGFETFNFIQSPSKDHFSVLHQYIYLRDIANIMRFCLEKFTVPPQSILYSEHRNWDEVVALMRSELSVEAMQGCGRRIVEFWGLLYMLGLYDYNLCWTLNLCWWLLMQALPEQYHRPVETWVEEMYATWSADEFPNIQLGGDESFPSLTEMMYSLRVDVAGESASEIPVI